jgi:hypothetical protein
VDGLREKFDEFLDTLSVKMEEVKDEVSDFTEKDTIKESRAGKETKTATG